MNRESLKLKEIDIVLDVIEDAEKRENFRAALDSIDSKEKKLSLFNTLLKIDDNNARNDFINIIISLPPAEQSAHIDQILSYQDPEKQISYITELNSSMSELERSGTNDLSRSIDAKTEGLLNPVSLSQSALEEEMVGVPRSPTKPSSLYSASLYGIEQSSIDSGDFDDEHFKEIFFSSPDCKELNEQLTKFYATAREVRNKLTNIDHLINAIKSSKTDYEAEHQRTKPSNQPRQSKISGALEAFLTSISR